MFCNWASISNLSRKTINMLHSFCVCGGRNREKENKKKTKESRRRIWPSVYQFSDFACGWPRLMSRAFFLLFDFAKRMRLQDGRRKIQRKSLTLFFIYFYSNLFELQKKKNALHQLIDFKGFVSFLLFVPDVSQSGVIVGSVRLGRPYKKKKWMDLNFKKKKRKGRILGTRVFVNIRAKRARQWASRFVETSDTYRDFAWDYHEQTVNGNGKNSFFFFLI